MKNLGKLELLHNLTLNTRNFAHLNIDVTNEHKSLTLNMTLCADEYV